MTSLRKILTLLTSGLLAALAQPAVAGPSGAKLFYAEFPTNVVSSTKVSVIIHNTSTLNGVSTINSMQLGITSPAGVTITAVKMTAPAVMTPTMTPSAGGTSVIITDFPGIKNHDDATFELTLAGVNCGSTVNFFVNANSGNAYPAGDEFGKSRTDLLTTSFNCDGILKCPSLPSTDPGIYDYQDSSGGNTTYLKRWENKDGSACIAIPFDLSFSNQDRQVTILWDQSTQPYASLETKTVWPPNLVDSSTGLPRPVEYSLDGTNFYDVPTCISSVAPTSLGTLAAPVATGDVTIQIAAASLPAAPFPVVIASNVAGVHPERMLVTGYPAPVAGVFTANVTRATGGTPLTTHATGMPVETTPLPIATNTLNGPTIGKQVPVCIIEQNDLTLPWGTAGCPAQTTESLLGCFRGTTRLFILGDVLIKSP